MEIFEALLVMLLTAVALLAAARRIGVPYPTMLALAGAAMALVPVQLPFRIEPDLALALFVAPILLDAAYDAPVRDLKVLWRPILGLVLIAVGLTTAAVAVIAHTLVPGLPWAAAVALGAIVAPPDATAAIAVLRQMKLPHQLSVILEGESLLNDASAILIYRLAVSAALAGGSVTAQAVAPAFLLSVVGSLVAGPLIAFVWTRVDELVTDPPSAVIMQFVGTFGIWVIAEQLHLSPILTVVAYAVTIARWAPARTPARLRVPSYAVWDTAVVVLNVLAFGMIGLEVGPIIASAAPGELARWLVFGGAILGTVILIRLLWVLGHNRWTRYFRQALFSGDSPLERPTLPGGIVVGWCGMRGIVTVATALALPEDFPKRDLLLFTAFAVTLGTLTIQGLTLGPLIRWMKLEGDDAVEREVRAARVALADAALEELAEHDDPSVRQMRADIEVERRTAAEATEGDGRPHLASKAIHAEILKRRRARLLALREDGTIGDDAFHRLEEELDFADLATAQRV